MNISEIMEAFAQELEDSENVALKNADHDDETLETVAAACLQAAAIFREAAKKTKKVCKDCKNGCDCKKGKCDCGPGCDCCKKDMKKKASEEEEFSINVETLTEMVAIANEFDASGDPLLQKQANVLDQILLTILAPKGAKYAAESAEQKKIEELKKEYAKTKETLDEQGKVSEAVKDIEKSEYYKEYRPLEAALNTRYCPEHPGELVKRVGEHQYQCSLDNKVFNWETGFRTYKGNKVPGGRVEDQSNQNYVEPHALFDTRETRLNK